MIYVVGLGPGNEDQMTPRALAALEKCDIIIGYKAYIELVRHLFEGRKELVASPMKGETERCRMVLELSKQGRTVGLISSGDPGVYGMAGIMLEIANGEAEVEIGRARRAADARLRGDKPQRPAHAVGAYREASARGRRGGLRNLPLQPREPRTARAPRARLRDTHGGKARIYETFGVTTLGELPKAPIDMFCTVIVGNSATRELGGRLVTPRGYKD